MTQSNRKKYSNQVRIIGGTCRGRKLVFHDAEGLRPTPDMVREKLFNWLGQDLTGKSVLDLFGGSGALGFEAASRNARSVVIVDNCRKTVQTLKTNCKNLGFGQVQINHADGLGYLAACKEKFDVVLLDPPFVWQDWDKLFQVLPMCLKEGAAVYIEAGKLPEKPENFEVYRDGKAGMSKFELLVFGKTE